MPGCHYQSRTERENDMDKTYEPIGNKPGEKIKVDSIDTIVTTHGDNCVLDGSCKTTSYGTGSADYSVRW